MTRAAALAALLALPDEPCLHRGRRYTQPRDPRRDPEIIKRDLWMGYATWRLHDHRNGDISCVVSMRRHALYAMRKRA